MRNHHRAPLLAGPPLGAEHGSWPRGNRIPTGDVRNAGRRATLEDEVKGRNRMGRANFRVRVRAAAEGFKARISASPDIWDETPDRGQDWVAELGDVSDWLELPPDFRAPDDGEPAYRRLPINFEMTLRDDELDEVWSKYGVVSDTPRLVHPHSD
jgi:hypothetical protein